MYCQQCGKEVDDEARFCSSCGASLTGGQAPAATGGAPAGPPDRTKALRDFVLLVCIGFGIVLFVGSAFAQMDMGDNQQLLGVTIYNFVLGAAFITAAVLFMIQHRRAPYLAGVTAFVYIVCTVVNEMVQLAHGQDMFDRSQRLTAAQSAWDILFWSFFPAFALILSIIIIRMGRRSTTSPQEPSP